MTSRATGNIVLLGSGETLPFSGPIHEWVAGRLPKPPRIVIVETPAGFEPNSAAVAEKIKQFLERRLQNYNPQIEVVPARQRNTPASPDNPDIVAPILMADEILLGPGSPTYCVRQLRDSLALQMIAARQRLGATLFLSSAATLAFGSQTMPVYEIYKVGERLHWQKGLDFFGAYGLPLTIIPHWNNQDGGSALDTSRCYIGQDRFQRLYQMLPSEHTVVGIDEHTALILDFDQGCFHVRGNSAVTLLRQGQSEKFQSGMSFPLDRLGEWHLPEGAQGIDPTVWEETLAADVARAKRRSSPPAAPEPPAEVKSLAQARTEARDVQDWARADALRAQIAALGWQVQDTLEGSRLTQKESPEA